jgi:hypothetical protein
MGGCPIDRDAVLTSTIGAALDATTQSLVDSLSAYLANK